MRPESWGLPPCILLVLVLWAQFSAPSEAAATPGYNKNAAAIGGVTVEGTVLCGTCFPTTSTETRKLYLAGASVAVECPGTTIYKEAKTNNYGVFQVLLEDVHQVDLHSCSLKLVRGNSRFCAVASNAPSHSKGDRGVYNAGVFTFQPQRQLEPCYQEPSFTGEEEKLPSVVATRDQSQPLPRRLPRGSFRGPTFFPPNPLQPPSLPPNPLTPPPSLLPPTPLTPPPTLLPPTPLTPSPPSLLPPNPFQPPSPPSILPHNPFQPPPSPTPSIFPPNPFRPPSPPPSSLFPPNPFRPPTLLPPGPPPSILPRNPFERPPPSSVLPRNPFQAPSPPGSLIPPPNPFRPPTFLPPNPPSLQQPTQPSPSLLQPNPLQQSPSLLPSNPFQQPSPLLPPLLGAPLLPGVTQPSPPQLSLGLPPFPFFPGFPPATPSPP